MPSGRFQSTLPVGGATRRADGSQIAEAISIHAPRGGSDQKNYVIKGRTLISIHAPRGGSDIPFLVASSRSWHFNPRSPWGERLLRLPIFLLNPSNFNPRSPWGERPSHATLCLTPLSISIHAPRGGSDGTFPPFPSSVRYFNPRSPWGERPNPYFSSWVSSVFQSTLPVGGATTLLFSSSSLAKFQSTLPVGGATIVGWISFRRRMLFQSTLPVGGATRRSSRRWCG